MKVGELYDNCFTIRYIAASEEEANEFCMKYPQTRVIDKKDKTRIIIVDSDSEMVNEALEYAETLDSLIDGDTEDELGACLEPIRQYLLKIGNLLNEKNSQDQVN
ncbi:hypothetical protein N8590_03665 [bacterium]|nr:hypothetical protein [bacterium]